LKKLGVPRVINDQSIKIGTERGKVMVIKKTENNHGAQSLLFFLSNSPFVIGRPAIPHGSLRMIRILRLRK